MNRSLLLGSTVVTGLALSSVLGVFLTASSGAGRSEGAARAVPSLWA